MRRVVVWSLCRIRHPGGDLNRRPESFPELPAESHPFLLLPEKTVTLRLADDQEPVELRYREAGSGTPVLLLHGLWTEAFTFRHLIDPLYDDMRLIMPELVDPSCEPDAYRPERLADIFLALIRDLGLARPVLVAHAESGLAGLLLGLRHPRALRALMVIGASLELPLMTGARGRIMANNWLLEQRAAAGCKQPIQAAMAMIDYKDSTVISRQEIRSLARRFMSLPSARAAVRIQAMTRSPAYRKEIARELQVRAEKQAAYPVPLSIVVGEADRLATLAQGKRLNRLFPGSELMLAENSSGAVQMERHEWLADAIRSLVRRIGQASD